MISLAGAITIFFMMVMRELFLMIRWVCLLLMFFSPGVVHGLFLSLDGNLLAEFLPSGVNLNFSFLINMLDWVLNLSIFFHLFSAWGRD